MGVRMSIETKATSKRFVKLAVTTALATTALTGCTGKVAPSHAYSREHAETALLKGKASQAVEYAEDRCACRAPPMPIPVLSWATPISKTDASLRRRHFCRGDRIG